MDKLCVFKNRALNFRCYVVLLISLLLSACNTETVVVHYIDGVLPLKGTPANSGVVVVEFELVLPAGYQFARVQPFGVEESAYLENIETKELYFFSRQRDSILLFHGLPAGQYRFIKGSTSAYLTNDFVEEQRLLYEEEQRYLYDFALRGSIENQIIDVAVGQAVYYGRLDIFGQPRPGFEALSPHSGSTDTDPVGPMDTILTEDAKRESYVRSILAKEYANASPDWAEVFLAQ